MSSPKTSTLSANTTRSTTDSLHTARERVRPLTTCLQRCCPTKLVNAHGQNAALSRDGTGWRRPSLSGPGSSHRERKRRCLLRAPTATVDQALNTSPDRHGSPPTLQLSAPWVGQPPPIASPEERLRGAQTSNARSDARRWPARSHHNGATPRRGNSFSRAVELTAALTASQLGPS